MRQILIIAGLDPSGNAGLLRDLQVLSRFPLKAYAVVTALTAQNRSRFFSANVVSPSVFSGELESVSPLSQFSAIKIGMLGNEQIVKSLVHFLRGQKKLPPIVLDPVYQSTTGGMLLTPAGKKLLWTQLLPLVSLWTPNLGEASFFSGIKISSKEKMVEAAKKLWSEKETPVLIKGFKEGKKISDLFYEGKKCSWFESRLIPGRHRGLGCALSSWIAAHLALGKRPEEAISAARRKMGPSFA